MDKPDDSAKRRNHSFVERTVAFSDGVAAIAITLLVLPLVDLEPPDLEHGQTIGDAVRANQDALLAFAITFVVIASLWFAHTRVFATVGSTDGVIAWANMAYLLSVVVLPFAASWLQDDGFAAGVGTFYYLVLMLASGSLGVISRRLQRHPELYTEEARTDQRLRSRKGLFLGAFFLVGAIVSWFWPGIAAWYMIVLWPLSIVIGRYEDRLAASTPQEVT